MVAVAMAVRPPFLTEVPMLDANHVTVTVRLVVEGTDTNPT
jgi:hypothetical protein